MLERPPSLGSTPSRPPSGERVRRGAEEDVHDLRGTGVVCAVRIVVFGEVEVERIERDAAFHVGQDAGQAAPAAVDELA